MWSKCKESKQDIKACVLITVLRAADVDCSSSNAYAFAVGDIPHADEVS